MDRCPGNRTGLNLAVFDAVGSKKLCAVKGVDIQWLRCETLVSHKSRVSRRFEFGVVSGPYGVGHGVPPAHNTQHKGPHFHV